MAPGIYARTLESLEEKARLSHDDIARVVGSSPRSISRWAHGEADPRSRSRDRLLETAAVVTELSNVLVSDAAHVWLFTPNPFLEFDRPIDLVAEGQYRRVLSAIAALADGVFV
jgi:putative toxin-antitoxin system antitoxin component (TIGR02293 family)